MPKISFVMPTKNRAKIIGETVKSIIQQTEEDWELVVVDDHSDPADQTEKILEKFNEKRIKYYRMPTKWSGGISEARNFGNMMAQSPIIGVCDSDDLYKKERAKLTIESFERYKWDVFYGLVEISDLASGECKLREGRYPVEEYSVEKIKSYNLIPHGSAAYKTELARDFPYNSFFKIAEDYDLFTRLAKAEKKFYFCNQIIYRYIIHGDNVSLNGLPGNYGKLIKGNRGWEAIDRTQILDQIIEK